MGSDFQKGRTYLGHILGQLWIPQLGFCGRYGPVVDAPPPFPYLRACTLSTEFC